MKVHLILVTKYRKKIFQEKERADDIKQFMHESAENLNCTIIQMETDKDHIHVLFEYSPKQSVAEIVKYFKQYTTYKIWKAHNNYLCRQYWKHKQLWSDGYFVCSIGQVSQAIIEKYIQNQG